MWVAAQAKMRAHHIRCIQTLQPAELTLCGRVCKLRCKASEAKCDSIAKCVSH